MVIVCYASLVASECPNEGHACIKCVKLMQSIRQSGYRFSYVSIVIQMLFQVYLCHKKDPFPSVLPANLFQKPGFKNFTASTVILTDDEMLRVDVVMFCTGYHYKFPFLDHEAL